MNRPELPLYYTVFITTKFPSLEVVKREAPQLLAEHLQTSERLHRQGELVMAGAFLDRPEGPISTMAVLVSEEAAKRFIEGDPFVRAGQVQHWEIRPWANMLRAAAGKPA